MVKTKKRTLKNIKKDKKTRKRKKKLKKRCYKKKIIKGGYENENKSNNGIFSWIGDFFDAIFKIFS